MKKTLNDGPGNFTVGKDSSSFWMDYSFEPSTSTSGTLTVISSHDYGFSGNMEMMSGFPSRIEQPPGNSYFIKNIPLNAVNSLCITPTKGPSNPRLLVIEFKKIDFETPTSTPTPPPTLPPPPPTLPPTPPPTLPPTPPPTLPPTPPPTPTPTIPMGFDKFDPDGYINGQPAIYMDFKGQISTGSRIQTQTGFGQSEIITSSTGASVTDFAITPFIRARTINVIAKNLKPNTKFFILFDEDNVTTLCNNGLDIISDAFGKIDINFNLPGGKYKNGEHKFKIVDTLEKYNINSFAETKYTVNGLNQTKQETFLSTREPTLVTVESGKENFNKTTVSWVNTTKLIPTSTPSITPSQTPSPSLSHSPIPPCILTCSSYSKTGVDSGQFTIYSNGAWISTVNNGSATLSPASGNSCNNSIINVSNVSVLGSITITNTDYNCSQTVNIIPGCIIDIISPYNNISKTVSISTNGNWQINNLPADIIATPASGNVTVVGTAQLFLITFSGYGLFENASNVTFKNISYNCEKVISLPAIACSFEITKPYNPISKTLTVNSNFSWHIHANPNFVTVTPSVGNVGPTDLIISNISQNSSITFIQDNERCSTLVTLEFQVCSISLSEYNIETNTINLESNGNWDISEKTPTTLVVLPISGNTTTNPIQIKISTIPKDGGYVTFRNITHTCSKVLIIPPCLITSIYSMRIITVTSTGKWSTPKITGITLSQYSGEASQTGIQINVTNTLSLGPTLTFTVTNRTECSSTVRIPDLSCEMESSQYDKIKKTATILSNGPWNTTATNGIIVSPDSSPNAAINPVTLTFSKIPLTGGTVTVKNTKFRLCETTINVVSNCLMTSVYNTVNKSVTITALGNWIVTDSLNGIKVPLVRPTITISANSGTGNSTIFVSEVYPPSQILYFKNTSADYANCTSQVTIPGSPCTITSSYNNSSKTITVNASAPWTTPEIAGITLGKYSGIKGTITFSAVSTLLIDKTLKFTVTPIGTYTCFSNVIISAKPCDITLNTDFTQTTPGSGTAKITFNGPWTVTFKTSGISINISSGIANPFNFVISGIPVSGGKITFKITNTTCVLDLICTYTPVTTCSLSVNTSFTQTTPGSGTAVLSSNNGWIISLNLKNIVVNPNSLTGIINNRSVTFSSIPSSGGSVTFKNGTCTQIINCTNTSPTCSITPSTYSVATSDPDNSGSATISVTFNTSWTFVSSNVILKNSSGTLYNLLTRNAGTHNIYLSNILNTTSTITFYGNIAGCQVIISCKNTPPDPDPDPDPTCTLTATLASNPIGTFRTYKIKLFTTASLGWELNLNNSEPGWGAVDVVPNTGNPNVITDVTISYIPLGGTKISFINSGVSDPAGFCEQFLTVPYQGCSFDIKGFDKKIGPGAAQNTAIDVSIYSDSSWETTFSGSGITLTPSSGLKGTTLASANITLGNTGGTITFKNRTCLSIQPVTLGVRCSIKITDFNRTTLTATVTSNESWSASQTVAYGVRVNPAIFTATSTSLVSTTVTFSDLREYDCDVKFTTTAGCYESIKIPKKPSTTPTECTLTLTAIFEQPSETIGNNENYTVNIASISSSSPWSLTSVTFSDGSTGEWVISPQNGVAGNNQIITGTRNTGRGSVRTTPTITIYIKAKNDCGLTDSCDSSAVKIIDPLAQSFFVDVATNPEGIFLSSAEIFFRTKSNKSPVTFELRPSVNGYPSSTEIIPFSQVSLHPSEINISEDAQTATKFNFIAPVYLKSGEYFFVIRANDTKYQVWMAKLGHFELGSDENRVSKNPFIGVLMRSSNNVTWIPESESDLKFRLNRCSFDTSKVYNCIIENKPYFSNEAIPTSKKFNTIRLNVVDLIPANTLISNYKLNFLNVDEKIISKNMKFNESNELLDTYILKDLNGISPKEITKSLTNIEELDENNISNQIYTKEKIVSNKNYYNPSILINCDFSTENEFVSPVIDIQRLSSTLIENKINLLDDLGIESELQINMGDAKARYVTKAVVLPDNIPANILFISFAANIPKNTSVECKIRVYYKIYNSKTDTNYNIRLKHWLFLDIAEIKSSSENEFIDFEFKTENSGEFNQFMVKLVLESSNSGFVPKVKDLRVIALTN